MEHINGLIYLYAVWTHDSVGVPYRCSYEYFILSGQMFWNLLLPATANWQMLSQLAYSESGFVFEPWKTPDIDSNALIWIQR